MARKVRHTHSHVHTSGTKKRGRARSKSATKDRNALGQFKRGHGKIRKSRRR